MFRATAEYVVNFRPNILKMHAPIDVFYSRLNISTGRVKFHDKGILSRLKVSSYILLQFYFKKIFHYPLFWMRLNSFKFKRFQSFIILGLLNYVIK